MKGMWPLAVALLATLLLGGCGGITVRNFGSFDPRLERNAVYVIPFDATLVPQDFGDQVFDEFVDQLNAQRTKTRVARFLILKEDLKEVEPAWLLKQTYISGDIWGYLENSGCCSTEMKVKSRIYLYEPGRNDPSMEVLLPAEDYVEHDRMPVSSAKTRMGRKLARSLADAVIRKFTP